MGQGGGSQKKKLYTMRFTHNAANFDITFDTHHQNWSKIFFMNIRARSHCDSNDILF